MKRIAILHSGNLQDISLGGISEYVSQLIKFSQSEVIVLGTEHKNQGYRTWKPYKRKIENKDYTFIPVNFDNNRPISIYYFVNLLFFMLFNRNLFRNIDVFYAQRMEYILPFCIFFRRKKVIMAVHGSGKYASMFWGALVAKVYSTLEHISIKRATKVFVLNNNQDFGVPYYKEKYKKFKDKIFYTLVPVNTELFKSIGKELVRKKYNIALTDKIILFLGRIEFNPKRVHLLPAILSSVRNSLPNTKLLIVGSGNDKGALSNSLEQQGLLQHTIFIDYVKHGQELVNIINCADVSLVCSSFEGICMSALESISSGVPVIATNVGDIKEYLINGKNGYLVNKTKEIDIIIEMSQLILNLFNKGLEVKKDTIQRFTAINVVKETESLLLN